MRHTLCPYCGDTGRFLDGPSEFASVEYYRCEPCGHVWYYDKGQPDGIAHDVTEHRIDPSDQRDPRDLIQEIRALKWRFDAIHASGQQALADGDVAGAKVSMAIQRELIAELKALLAQRDAARRKKRLAISS